MAGPLLDCDDGLCALRELRPASGCVFTDNDLSCDDGDVCTLGIPAGAECARAAQEFSLAMMQILVPRIRVIR